MPKMKSHKGAAKRFKYTGKGKIRRHRAYANHLFLSKSTKRKRTLRKSTLVDKTNVKRLRRLLPN
ncbi:MAG: 50S ribosomal protein L35 [Candidatus Poribacteria bacterium]|nr:50S ribosomal protein L35 [Candidatus Poribacteria bacterium]